MSLDDHISAAERIPGWMDADELAWLAGMASYAKRVVEVGCWQGRTSKVLANSVGGELICVDSFIGDGPGERIEGDDLEARWREHLADELVAGKVRLIRAPSLVAASEFKARSVDMVFIDGDHVSPAPFDDVVAWLPIIRSTGILCGHDLGHPGVDAAVASLEGVERGPGSLWWCKVVRP